MKVSELITFLQAQKPDVDVVLEVDYGYYHIERVINPMDHAGYVVPTIRVGDKEFDSRFDNVDNDAWDEE